MFNILAHAAHNENMTTIYALDHCSPIIIGASVIIVFLLVVTAYMLNTWQPKSFTNNKKKITKK